MTLAVPEEWPPEATELYEPVRELGKGGFGSVVLARRKDGEEPKLVAMKVVGSHHVTNEEVGYAHREMDILVELNHPCIMRLIAHWEPPKDADKCAAVMALSYSKGPTLEKLLSVGGKLSFVFARIVAAQFIDAIAYLHSRAVVHRDIKPDNIIVTGANTDQDEIWDDADIEKEQDWDFLRQKWKITLVDFGFARALTPDDMSKAITRQRSADADSSAGKSVGSSSRRSTRSSRLGASRKFGRQMSAVGNRSYAAPEILKGVHKEKRNLTFDSNHSVDVTKTLSDYVSYYGMLVDAYSVGSTLKYMMTGAPPNEDVEDIIALENNPLSMLCRALCGSKSNAEGGREVKYRSYKKIPPEVLRLIKGMTHYDPEQRSSVRAARLYPWIDDALPEEHKLPKEIDYLSIALKHSKIAAAD